MNYTTGTVIVEADSDVADLKRRLHAVLGDVNIEHQHVLLVCNESQRGLVTEILTTEFPPLTVISLSPAHPDDDSRRVFTQVRTPGVGLLRAGASYTTPQWDILEAGEALAVWIPDMSFPADTAHTYGAAVRSWLGSTDLLRRLCGSSGCSEWNVMCFAEEARRSRIDFRWSSPRGVATSETTVEPATGNFASLSLDSSVVAIVPHYKCEEWLDDCLYSLVRQTQPLAGIVVVDDHSASPPVEIASKYPQVTLMRATENSGPYRLTQQVINETFCDAYMFQDADDWSTDDRLKVLLTEAERTGAELIGSQMLQVFRQDEAIIPMYYPLDVSQAYPRHQRHPIVHGTTLVTRDLVQRVGGFSTALRFGGDSEFLRRVGFTARIVNSTRFCYFQRVRQGSLTQAPETGMGSPAREALMADIRQWVEKHKAALVAGDIQAVRPYAMAAPVELEHLVGPSLNELSRIQASPDGLSSQAAV